MMRESGISGLLTAALLTAATATSAFAQGKPAPVPPSTLFLAGTCSSCHGTEGRGIGTIPPLAGKERAFLREQLKLYRTDVLKGTLMNQLSKGFTEAELDALADYWSTKK